MDELMEIRNSIQNKLKMCEWKMTKEKRAKPAGQEGLKPKVRAYKEILRIIDRKIDRDLDEMAKEWDKKQNTLKIEQNA